MYTTLSLGITFACAHFKIILYIFPLQHRENRMVQEKELLEKKIEWLTGELKSKTEELLNTSRVKGEEILQLNSSLKTSTEQVTSC